MKLKQENMKEQVTFDKQEAMKMINGMLVVILAGKTEAFEYLQNSVIYLAKKLGADLTKEELEQIKEYEQWLFNYKD